MSESIRPAQEREEFSAYYFDTFLEWAPDAHRRHIFALQVSDPEHVNRDGIDLPTSHHGYNLLLGNWNSPEPRLRHTYRQFIELSHSVASARQGDPVIVGEPMPLSEMEHIHEWPHYEAMEGPARLQIGYLASQALDFQYKSKLQKGGKGVQNVKPPYLLTAARLQLFDVQEYCFDFDIGMSSSGTKREESKIRAITLGSTLDSKEATYREQHFAEASPVIIGNEECSDFIAYLKEQYLVIE